MNNLLTIGFVLCLFLFGCQNELDTQSPIIGVKIYNTQSNYQGLVEEWNDLGINTALVSVDLAYDRSFRTLTSKNDIQVFIILPIFFNSEVLQENSDWYAIDQNGNRAREEWVEFVSPSNDVYRKQKIDFIKKVIRETRPDGISIDFIRYFAYWEKIYEDGSFSSIPNTSFDSLSLAAFQSDMNFQIPDTLQAISQKANWILENHEMSWTNWKCKNITSMVEDIVESAKFIDSNLQINLHAVPWRNGDFNGAIKKIVGQDFAQLGHYADFISPMCYSHMLKKEPGWVSSVVEDLKLQSNGSAILPSIQVKEAYLSHPLTNKEFEQNIISALEPPSEGVVLWSWEHLMDSPAKKEILKKMTGAL